MNFEINAMNKYLVLMIVDFVVVAIALAAMAYIFLLPSGDQIGKIVFYIICIPMISDRVKSFVMTKAFCREERLKAKKVPNSIKSDTNTKS